MGEGAGVSHLYERQKERDDLFLQETMIIITVN